MSSEPAASRPPSEKELSRLRESAEKYRALFECALDGLFVFDEVAEDVNEKLCRLLGCRREDLIGHSPREFWPARQPDGRDSLQAGEELIRAAKAGVPQNFYWQHRRKDGTLVDTEVSLASVTIGGRSVLLGMVRDVGERRQVEEALRRSEERLELAMRGAQDGLWDWDVETNRLYLSPRWKEMLGYAGDDIGDTPEGLSRLVHPEDESRLMEGLRAFRQSQNEVFEVELRMRHREGHYVWILSRSFGLRDAEGRLVRMVGLHTELTERKQAEQERIEHVRFLESMGRLERAIRGRVNLDQMMTDVLDVVRSTFSCDRAWLLYPCDPEAPSWQVPMLRHVPEYPVDPSVAQGQAMTPEGAEVIRRALAAEGPIQIGAGDSPKLLAEVVHRYGVKSQIVMALHPKVGRPWMFGLHQCSRCRVWSPEEERLFCEMGRRIADSLTGLLTLRDYRESEERFRTLVEQAADGIFVHDLDGQLVLVNPRACESLGYTQDELLSMNVRDLDPEFHNQVHPVRYWAALPLKKVVSFESLHRRKDGSIFPVEVRLCLIDMHGRRFILGSARDITERKQAELDKAKLEAQLRQSQKLEAVGQLAGGVAHDFNNILTAIFGNVDLAISDLEAHFPSARGLRDGLQQIQHSAKRASALTRQLLAFSRRQVVRPEVLDLNRTILDLEKMLRRLIAENIRLELYLAPKLAALEADPGQLEQVIVNLVVNARDAMPEGGTLTLETSNAMVDDTYLVTHADARTGKHVVLAVSDTGCGMDRATLERAFEPFFTTKPPGHGTGLGLSTVYGIVKQAGGHISAYSEPGKGTSFRVYLPSVEKPVAAPSAQRPEPASPTGSETILLCEDDNVVRELAAQILADAGYTVLAAHNSLHALQLARERNGPIHLLLTDVVMPELNGRKLSDAVIALRPGLRTLFISGYTSNIIAHHGVLDEGVEFLEKPFSRRALLQRVREVLGAPLASPAPLAPPGPGGARQFPPGP